MSQRYPPLSGFNPRDRSPQRFQDRRPPSGPRGSDDAIPPPLGREPPRGPKALIDPPRGGHYGGGRGRGYPGRGSDFRDRDRDRDLRDRDRDRDRDFRDLRDGPPPFRRDMDREWGRRDRDFDHRDSRVGFGRGRSRSPPPRDFRDMREPLVRDPDVIRMRRGSRDSLLSTSSGPHDGPPPIGHHPRSGPIRGRGRGDWDGGRGRGRPGPFIDDRDSFRRRSRSRDGWWDQRDRDRERDRERMMDIRDRERDRERERERDRDRERDRELILDRRDRERDRDILMDRRGDRFDRRDEPDRRFERDDRDRPADFWKRDRHPAPTIPSSLPPHNPPPSLPSAPVPPPSDRPLDRPPPDRAPNRPADQPTEDQARKPSIAESRRDAADRPDFLPPRPEPPKEAPPVRRSPPPSAPQVPAFGSVTVPAAAQSSEKDSIDSAPTGPPPPTRAEKERNEPPPSSRPSMHPPTGPKAERGGPLQPPLELRIRRDDGSEPPGKADTSSRGPKPHSAGPAIGPKSTPDLSPPTAPAAMTASKHGGTTHPELPIATKLGPGPTSPVLDRGPPLDTTSPGSQTSPRLPYSSIPTGPRALQQRQAPPPPSRGPPKGSKQWVRPGYTHSPGAVPPPKRNSVDGKPRSLSVASEELKQEPAASADDSDQELEAGEIAPTKEAPPFYVPVKSPHKEQILRRFTPPPKSSPPRSLQEKPPPSREETKPVKEDRSQAVIPDFGDEDDEDEDENIVFTQEYLAERKQIFEKDMQALQAEMPPPPLEDPTVVRLLMQIQLLGMVAYDTPEPVVEPVAKPSAEQARELEFEPESEREIASESEPQPEPGQPMEVDEPRETDVAVDETPGERVDEKQVPSLEYKQDEEPPVKFVLDSVPAADAISLENLPFLNTGPPTPISDLDTSQANAANFQALRETLRQEVKQRRKETSKKNAALREDYLSIYKPWRLEIWELDNENGKNNRVTPGPTPPPPPPPPPLPLPAPVTTAEARRYKGNSELDFQNALRASEISHQEDQLRRGKGGGAEPTARPDPMKEAIIPDMLEPAEAKAAVYKDTNNNIPVTDALAVFGFLPPSNDFTPSEHEKFTNAFMAHPKKWGKIAEALPGRDFQQCIIHYYLTKEEIKYKAKLNKRWSRRGRAKRTSRPKSHALMADLGVVKPDYEGEEEPAPVTDTGRPRRAAAPTFGDMDAEAVPNGRRGVPVKETSEQPEKPAARRGRTGPGSRGGRRGKAAQSHPPQSQPPSQPLTPTEQTAVSVAVPPPAPMPRLPKREGPEPSVEPNDTEAAVPQPKERREREQSDIPPPHPQRGRAGRMRQRDGQYVFESTEPESSSATRTPEVGGYGSMQPTSYWSVPEQRDFPLLLAHFGRDYEGISNFMKTKTTVMVKNYFQRRIDSGQKDFEDIVSESERKKARGESTGPLPTPSVPPKRRYEATPSSIVPRPLAPHTDTGEPDKNKTATLASQAVPLHARGPAERERSVPRFAPLAQATASMPASTLLNEDPRTGRTSAAMPPRAQGPKMGFFTEDRREPPTTVLPHAAGSRVQEAQVQARQPTMQAPDMARMDPLHPQGLRSSTVDLHGSPLLATQNPTTAPSHQPSYVQSQPQPPLVSSHSRHPSLGKPPGSPVQSLQRLEPDISPIGRDSITQRPLYPLPSQPASISQPPAPMLSPQKELSRPSSTPAEPDAPPRQVPAKRSNIMSILNDEPEPEPQPRKRLAGDQPSSASATPRTMSPTRSMYAGIQSLSQPAPPSRQEEMKAPTYTQPGPSLPPSRAYTDYPSYPSVSVGSGQPSNTDWMARFDPRNQQQQQAPPPQPLNSRPPPTLPPQPSYSSYTSGQPQAGSSLANLTSRSPAPPSPAPIQRQPYQSSVYGQSPSLPPSSRDLPSQGPVYRQSVGSPPPRNSGLGYGSRQGPPTPIQSSASLLNMGPRQPPTATPYGSTASTPTTTHLSGPHQPGSHQTYQQHVQTMVNGSHQQQPHRSAFGLTGGQYGHSTPPPAGATSRPPGGPPPPLSVSRSYTPPTILQPNPSGGVMGYGPSGPSPVVGPVHPQHARHPAEAPPGPLGGPSRHHRVYSQGSNSGPLPGPMTPQHPR